MRIHSINCGTFCVFSPERLYFGQGSMLRRALIPCRCLVIETDKKLILVDTGMSHAAIMDPMKEFGFVRGLTLNTVRDPSATAVEQLRALGFRPQDVSDIIVTHLDPDHAGGLCDFPQARVHVHESEFQSAVQASRPLFRYVPSQWSHVREWVRYSSFGENWKGFSAVRSLPGTDDSIMLIPLQGHTPGLTGIAVPQPSGWTFHVGDAIFQYDELSTVPTSLTIAKIFAKLNVYDEGQRAANVERLRELSKDSSVTILCSHDPAPGRSS